MFDLVALRQIVEPEAAALAAACASPDDVAELYHLCDGLAHPDIAKVMEADIAFHKRLWAASNNLVLGQLARPLGAIVVVGPRRTKLQGIARQPFRSQLNCRDRLAPSLRCGQER